MNNVVSLVYAPFYGKIVKGDLGYVFKGRQKVGLRFNKKVKLKEMKRKIIFSEPDIDKVPDDIDNEGLKEVEDAYGLSFSNPSCGIVLRKEPKGNMLRVDPNTTHASEFSEYTNIVPAQGLASNSQLEELFVEKWFENEADCVFSIKQYNMKVSIDYKVAKFTPILYVGECLRVSDRSGWWDWAAFIQRIQQWQIRKFEGCHTIYYCTYVSRPSKIRH
ncbi:hypothetical protein GOBAR_DD32401 [Gossypium barbadense]|nr:hypothetical protein GOBAR_DD32401 [Gossypium barbadense]